MYTEPEVVEQNGPGLGEDQASVRKLIKIFSIEETNLAEDLAELIRKMKIMRKPRGSFAAKNIAT